MHADPASYLLRALALARRGGRDVRPNPLVGALVRKDGAIIGRGWHEKAGGPHAEINALREAGGAAKGAALYVTLEPCNHQGRTGPCTEAILAAGIREVFFCSSDPNPHVAGGGAQFLSSRGVSIRGGILADRERELNVAWYHWLKHGRPFVTALLHLGLNGVKRSGEHAALLESSPLSAHLAWYDARVRNGQTELSGGSVKAFHLSEANAEFETLGKAGVQSLLVEDEQAASTLLEQGAVNRVVTIHSPNLVAAPLAVNATKLKLLRVRREGELPVSVYDVISA